MATGGNPHCGYPARNSAGGGGGEEKRERGWGTSSLQNRMIQTYPEGVMKPTIMRTRRKKAWWPWLVFAILGVSVLVVRVWAARLATQLRPAWPHRLLSAPKQVQKHCYQSQGTTTGGWSRDQYPR